MDAPVIISDSFGRTWRNGIINVAVGIAEGDDRVLGFAPDHCSITVLDVEDGALRLVRRGAQRATQVL